VVVLPSNHAVILYAFEKGWHDARPIMQKLDGINNITGPHVYHFDFVDKRGLLEGSTFVFYHMTSADDDPGEVYRVRWKSGYGWK
jgi:hypothetical protein